MKKVLVFLISFLIGFVIFFFVVKWVGFDEIKNTFASFSSIEGLLILLITLAIWIVGLWRWRFILKRIGYDFSLLKIVGVYFSSRTITFLFTPSAVFGGEFFKVYASKKILSVPWQKSLTSIIIEKVSAAMVLLVFILLGAVSFFFLVPTYLGSSIFQIIVGIIVLISIFIFFYFKNFRKKKVISSFLKKIGVKEDNSIFEIEEDVFSFFSIKNIYLWKELGITIIATSLIFFRSWLIIFFLTGHTSIFSSLVILFFMYVAYMFPFPLALGSSEAAQTFAFGALGLGKGMGITFSFILRGAEVLIALIGFVLLIKLIIRMFVFNIENIINRFKIK